MLYYLQALVRSTLSDSVKAIPTRSPPRHLAMVASVHKVLDTFSVAGWQRGFKNGSSSNDLARLFNKRTDGAAGSAQRDIGPA